MSSKRILILETDAEGDAVQISRSVGSMAEAGQEARAIEASVGALATLSGPELLSIYNHLQVSPATHVAKFETRAVGAKRVLDAFMALEILETDPVPVATNKKASKPKQPKAAAKASKAAGRPKKLLSGTLHIVQEIAAGKQWHKSSARYAAFVWIERNPGAALETYAQAIGKGALALLGKLVETGTVEVRAA